MKEHSLKRSWWQRFKSSTAHTQANIVCTLVMAIATCAYAFIAYRQLKAIGGQLDQMSKQFPEAQKSANAAHDSAEAAQSAADTASKSLKQSEARFREDERAWVVVDQISIRRAFSGSRDVAPSWEYNFYLKNIGRTTARSVSVRIDDFVGYEPPPKRMIDLAQKKWILQKSAPERPAPQSLAPGERSAEPILGSVQGPIRIKNSYWGGIIIGRIDYIDAFHARHWSTFCYYPMEDESGELAHCNAGNDQDTNPEPSP